MLSHYTTRDGLEGIAKSGSLWASNFLTVNDKSEFFYAWAELLKAGWRYALARVPEDLKRQDLDLEGAIELQAANSIPMFRSMVQSTEGYGHLFITSFAQARTADHERRGILTIWDRYTGHKGYCLQFDKGDIEHMISLEAMRGSYQWIELAEVKYGVDPNTCTFRELAAQLGEQFLMQVMREYADGRIAPNYEVQWAPSTLIRKMLSYCGTHKDPCYEDEREIRILVYPHDQADARVLTGVAAPKTIHKREDGRKHIVLGEYWRPGISPRRIIIGAKADVEIQQLVSQFHSRPEVAFCNLPVA